MKSLEREMSSHLYLLCNTRSTFLKLLSVSALALGLLVSHVGFAASPTAPLTARERAKLENHREVSRRMELKHQGRAYVTAISYGVARRSCDQVFSLLSSPAQHYKRALPATSDVRFETEGEKSSVWMKHGNALINGSYTAHFKASRKDGYVRFWLDKNKDRDVKDLFGYFRVQPWGPEHCLVTAAVAVDPGEGLVASMFRGMISDYAAKSAGRIQRYAQRTIQPNIASRTSALVTRTVSH